jgi:hypothetical protein
MGSGIAFRIIILKYSEQLFKRWRLIPLAIPDDQCRDHKYSCAQGAPWISDNFNGLDLDSRSSFTQTVNQPIRVKAAMSDRGFEISEFFQSRTSKQRTLDNLLLAIDSRL